MHGALLITTSKHNLHISASAFAKNFGRQFFIFAKATNISIFKQTFGRQVFQTANWACLQSVIAKRLTRTEKLNFDTKVQFSDKFSFRGDNYKIKLLSIVLTSLNSVDLTAELTKRIDLIADNHSELTNV